MEMKDTIQNIKRHKMAYNTKGYNLMGGKQILFSLLQHRQVKLVLVYNQGICRSSEVQFNSPFVRIWKSILKYF